jgi:hypothetical protein
MEPLTRYLKKIKIGVGWGGGLKGQQDKLGYF